VISEAFRSPRSHPTELIILLFALFPNFSRLLRPFHIFPHIFPYFCTFSERSWMTFLECTSLFRFALSSCRPRCLRSLWQHYPAWRIPRLFANFRLHLALPPFFGCRADLRPAPWVFFLSFFFLSSLVSNMRCPSNRPLHQRLVALATFPANHRRIAFARSPRSPCQVGKNSPPKAFLP